MVEKLFFGAARLQCCAGEAKALKLVKPSALDHMHSTRLENTQSCLVHRGDRLRDDDRPVDAGVAVAGIDRVHGDVISTRVVDRASPKGSSQPTITVPG